MYYKDIKINTENCFLIDCAVEQFKKIFLEENGKGGDKND